MRLLSERKGTERRFVNQLRAAHTAENSVFSRSERYSHAAPFRKRIRLLPGTWFNVSQSGASRSSRPMEPGNPDSIRANCG